jgi:hypothetical protein
MTERFNTTDYAIYLPAVTGEFANRVLQSVPLDRPFPNGLSLHDLAFWDRRNTLFHHPYCLHSIGQYRVSSVIDNALTRGGRSDRVLIGDSGGFQIGKGTLKGYDLLRVGMSAEDAEAAWADADDVRTWIITWLETHCQFAMTLDMPLWATTRNGADSPFHQCSVDQLTAMTVENLRYIESNRQGKTQWLNVVQGLDEHSTWAWFDAVKWFRYGGWALAGNAGAKGGLYRLLNTVLLMRDDDAFAAGQDWLHVLGVSTLGWSVILTAIQQQLRQQNPALTISFDSSSPFQIAGRNEQACYLPDLGDHVSSWKIRVDQSPQGDVYVGSTAPFPHASPLGQRMTLGDLNVYQGLYQKRRYDPISLAMLVHHNVYVYLKAFDMANTAAFAEQAQDKVPRVYRQCIDVIGEAFDRPDWYAFLYREKPLFDAHSQ